MRSSQTRDMIATLAGTDLPADTLDALVARTDGVPLYIEELTKATMEPGAARGVEAIPASLADSLMGRLDRLSAAKEVGELIAAFWPTRMCPGVTCTLAIPTGRWR